MTARPYFQTVEIDGLYNHHGGVDLLFKSTDGDHWAVLFALCETKTNMNPKKNKGVLAEIYIPPRRNRIQSGCLSEPS